MWCLALRLSLILLYTSSVVVVEIVGVTMFALACFIVGHDYYFRLGSDQYVPF